jgi:hypothetical protein
MEFTLTAYLLEADVISILPEALTAHVQTVFADETMTVGTDPAERKQFQKIRKEFQRLKFQFLQGLASGFQS